MATRILIADVDQSLSGEIAVALEKMGYETVTADDGREAQKIVNTTSPLPKALIFDSNLPEISTLKLCQEIRREIRTKKTPILLLMNEGADFDPFQELGYIETFPKPIKMDKVTWIVDAMAKYGGTRFIPKKVPFYKTVGFGMTVFGVVIAAIIFAVFILPYFLQD